MKIHDLKILPEYFEAVAQGLKTFEIRKNDRDFKVGHFLNLREWHPGRREYTGNWVTVKVTYMFQDDDGEFGLQADYVIMSIQVQ